ncbi:hypothetical protein [Aliiroseovarius subalbicans]|uniref:hypothetical protein n=1 Tax=Aliiroseovarius subalbicans TaxID=2925840 RepID=UPI001F5A6D71|nr:hypothetical protein [Aliiroseovarius subalbicans]MCI2401160.1 hypothetical protein [Aliiroseovarius subalbicans]
MIGALAIGMLVGFLTAIAALLSGYSLLMALWLYSSVGMFSTLISISGLNLALGHRNLDDRDT